MNTDSRGRPLKWHELYDRDAIQTTIDGIACEAYPVALAYGRFGEKWQAVPREGRFFKATARSPEQAFERLQELFRLFYGDQ